MCKSEDEVLQKVFYMLGTPSEAYCSHLLKLPKFDRNKWKGQNTQSHLDIMFPDAPPLAIDLMGKLLHLDPNKRLLAKQALNHPYLKTKK